MRHAMIGSWIVFITLVFVASLQVSGILDVKFGKVIQVLFWNLWIYTNFVFINYGLVRYRGYAL